MEENIKESIDILLNKIKEKDMDALDSLYDLTSKILYRCAYSYLRNKEDSEDALSDVYYLVVKNIQSFKGKNGYNWIYTITKNVCLNMIKRNNKQELIDPSSEEDINRYNIVEEEKENNNEKVSVVLSIAKEVLKPVELNIILLHVMDDMIFKDIGNVLGILEPTVRWKYNNAIGKLRKELERRQIAYD